MDTMHPVAFGDVGRRRDPAEETVVTTVNDAKEDTLGDVIFVVAQENSGNAFGAAGSTESLITKPSSGGFEISDS